MYKILLLGGSGFLGKNVLKEIENKYIVYSPSRSELNLRNKQSILNALINFKPDIVLYLVTNWPKNTSEVIVDASYLANLIDSILELKLTPYLVYASSMTVYGPISVPPVSESSKLQPKNAYGLSKVVGEQLIEYYSNNIGKCCILRFSGLYGPYRCDGAMYKFIISATNGNTIKVTGSPEERWDAIYVTDAVSAIKKCIELRISGTYNIGLGGNGIKMSKLIELICKRVKRVPVIYSAKLPVINFVYDITTAKRVLGFRPTPLVKALDKFILSLKANYKRID